MINKINNLERIFSYGHRFWSSVAKIKLWQELNCQKWTFSISFYKTPDGMEISRNAEEALPPSQSQLNMGLGIRGIKNFMHPCECSCRCWSSLVTADGFIEDMVAGLTVLVLALQVDIGRQ
jgi:hypothetical protein